MLGEYYMDKFSSTLLQDIDKLKQTVQTCETLSQVCSAFGYSNNGRNTKRVRAILDSLKIDFSHFREGVASKVYEYTKVCPKCNKEFKVLSNRDGNKKVTCSYTCANKYFSWKQGAKNYTGAEDRISYRDVLFNWLKKHNLSTACVVCGEQDVVDVHHIDEDRSNNEVDNLIVLCPTHHYSYHRYKTEAVLDKMLEHMDSRP
jgi:hypothetical protein